MFGRWPTRRGAGWPFLVDRHALRAMCDPVSIWHRPRTVAEVVNIAATYGDVTINGMLRSNG